MFTTTRRTWTYNAIASTILKTISLALADIGVNYAEGPHILPRHDATLRQRADGAYDQDSVSTAVAKRHPEAAIIVPPHSTAVPSETAEIEPTQRDRHLQFIAEHGRAAWQKASGYTKRARVEATVGRFKQVIGDGLRSRTDQRRATEVDVAVHALNRMLDFGRPNSIRVA